MKTVYVVFSEHRFIIGVYQSKGDAEREVTYCGNRGMSTHIMETILYPESWKEGNP